MNTGSLYHPLPIGRGKQIGLLQRPPGVAEHHPHQDHHLLQCPSPFSPGHPPCPGTQAKLGPCLPLCYGDDRAPPRDMLQEGRRTPTPEAAYSHWLSPSHRSQALSCCNASSSSDRDSSAHVPEAVGGTPTEWLGVHRAQDELWLQQHSQGCCVTQFPGGFWSPNPPQG